MPAEYSRENVDLVRKGCANLNHHIRNAVRVALHRVIRGQRGAACCELCGVRGWLWPQIRFGQRPVVAINQMTSDTPAEIEAVKQEALAAGAYGAVESNHWCAPRCPVWPSAPLMVWFRLLLQGGGRRWCNQAGRGRHAGVCSIPQ